MKLTKGDKDLIKEAENIILKSKKIKLLNTASMGAALVTSKGNLFCGVCMGFHCGIGSCAEYQAIGSMVSNGENEIKTIVAVSKNGNIHVPCGKCREMINQVCKKNKNTFVIISKSKKIKLKGLLPLAWEGSIEK